MQAQWQKTFQQLMFWLVAEIILNLSGLDNLADYSEFVFEPESFLSHAWSAEIAVVVPPKAH
jgi:hypothetical protein